MSDIIIDVCTGTRRRLELAAEETNQNLSCSGSEPLSNLSSQEEEPASPLASTFPEMARRGECQLPLQGGRTASYGPKNPSSQSLF